MKIKLTAEMRMRLAYAEELDITDIVAPIIAERDALAATVEALREALSEAVTAFHQYELSVDDYPTIKHKLLMQALNDELEATPQQHLRDLRAEAGRAGYFRGHMDAAGNDASEWDKKHSEYHANRYAERVKAGE